MNRDNEISDWDISLFGEEDQTKRIQIKDNPVYMKACIDTLIQSYNNNYCYRGIVSRFEDTFPKETFQLLMFEFAKTILFTYPEEAIEIVKEKSGNYNFADQEGRVSFIGNNY